MIPDVVDWAGWRAHAQPGCCVLHSNIRMPVQLNLCGCWLQTWQASINCCLEGQHSLLLMVRCRATWHVSARSAAPSFGPW